MNHILNKTRPDSNMAWDAIPFDHIPLVLDTIGSFHNVFLYDPIWKILGEF